MKEQPMPRLQLAIKQIQFARTYTLRMLEQTKEQDWFRQPAGGVTHIAWQVGHLAMGQYRLTMVRIRGERPEDTDLIAPEFLRQFGADSLPDADPAKNPTPSEIRTVLNRVHEQTLKELPKLDDAELDQPILVPHPRVKTKLESLLWCAQHEGVHAGQIGLLRRLLGYSPLW
jgi:uncharacterized damage-inducible protein DinB